MEAVQQLVRASKREPSRGLLLCGIGGFLLAFKGSLTFLFFQSNPRMGTAVTTGITLSYALLVLGYTILDPPKTSRDASPVLLRCISLYLVLSGASLAWTASNSVLVASAYWLGVAADVLSIRLLLRYRPVQDNADRIMQGFILGAAIVAVIAWTAPVMDDMRLGNEDFLHPNFIGFEFGIAALLAAYFAQQRKTWGWVCAGFVVTTVRTLSKATIVGLIFAGLYYVLRGLQISRKTRMFIALGSGLVILGFWGLLEAYLDVYTQGSNLETLTGRTYIWATSFEMVMEKPWIGHGFDSFRWLFPRFGTFQPWQAHDEWLQQLFAYGVIGLVIVIAIYLSFYQIIRTGRNTGMKSLATAILVLVLIRSLVDTDRFELCFPLWLMTMLSIALMSNPVPQRSQ